MLRDWGVSIFRPSDYPTGRYIGEYTRSITNEVARFRTSSNETWSVLRTIVIEPRTKAAVLVQRHLYCRPLHVIHVDDDRGDCRDRHCAA